MENGFKIVGKNITPEKREDFASQQKKIEKESREPFAREIEKNERGRKILQFINNCIAEKFKELGLEKCDIVLE